MRGNGALDPRSAARMLMAAALLDLLFAYLLARFLFPGLRPVLLTHLSADLRDFVFPLLVVLIVPVIWVVGDILAFGHTPGRLALGLAMSDAAGHPLRLHRRATRAGGKLLSLGLTGLRLDGPAPYDRLSGAVWRSAMALPGINELQLVFRSGPLKGKGGPLHRVPGYKPGVPIRIGRDPGWAQILISDAQVSGQHCELGLVNGVMCIRDLGSTHGTYIDGRRIASNTWYPLTGAREFAAATCRMALLS